MILWIWTISASVGAVFAALNLIDAYRDLHDLGDAQNGRRILGRGWVRGELIRLLIQASWAFIGIVALQVPAQPDAPVSLLTLLLIGTNVGLALNTILDARDRRALRRILG